MPRAALRALATDAVRFVGDALAVFVAETLAAAQHAAEFVSQSPDHATLNPCPSRKFVAHQPSSALGALAAGPTVLGAKARDDIVKGLFTLHVARHGRRGRHFVMFRVGHDQGREVIEVLRLLHDAMDLPRHLPPIDETK